MQQSKKGTIYVYWSGIQGFTDSIQGVTDSEFYNHLVLRKLEARIESNVKKNTHMNFVLCYFGGSITHSTEWDQFTRKLSKENTNFYLQEIFAKNVLNPEEEFLHPEYKRIVSFISSLGDDMLSYFIISHNAQTNGANNGTKIDIAKMKSFLISNFVAIHVLRNRNTVWLDQAARCIEMINIETEFRQVFLSSKAIIVGSKNDQHSMINKFILDMIPFIISFYENNVKVITLDCKDPKFDQSRVMQLMRLRRCLFELVSVADTLLITAGVLCTYGRYFQKQLLSDGALRVAECLNTNSDQMKQFIQEKKDALFNKLKGCYIFSEEIILPASRDFAGNPQSTNLSLHDFMDFGGGFSECDNIGTIYELLAAHSTLLRELTAYIIQVIFEGHYADFHLKASEMGKNDSDIRKWVLGSSSYLFNIMAQSKLKLEPEYRLVNIGVDLQSIIDMHSSLIEMYNRKDIVDKSNKKPKFHICIINPDINEIANMIIDKSYPELATRSEATDSIVVQVDRMEVYHEQSTERQMPEGGDQYLASNIKDGAIASPARKESSNMTLPCTNIVAEEFSPEAEEGSSRM